MKSYCAAACLSMCALAGYGGEDGLSGLAGQQLLRAVREKCRPERYVDDSYQWLRRNDSDAEGQLLLLLEGVSRMPSAEWPVDLTAVRVLPSEWWQYDSQLQDLPGRDLQNIVIGSLDFAQAKGVYPPFKVDEFTQTFGGAGVGLVKYDSVLTGAWEPAEDMKGDVARIAMYLLAVYPAEWWDPWCSLLYSGTGFSPQGLALMMEWSSQDPVDERERRRAQAVADAQGSMMNPFVRWPGFEEYVWGSKTGLPFTGGFQEDQPQYLKSVYQFSEDKIVLSSPYVHSEASWKVDGIKASGSVSVKALGVGKHTFEFTEPDGSEGSVIVTVKR